MGKLGIVLTRRYLLYIVVTIVVGFCLYLFILNESGHDHEASNILNLVISHIGPISDLTWSDFVKDCGFKSYQSNPHGAIAKFDRKYYN